MKLRWRVVAAAVLATALVVPTPVSAVDLPPAVAALKAAAERNDVSAQFALGRAYDRGDDVPPDLGQARAWYCKAAHQGHAEAAWRMSQIFLIGWGVPTDLANSRAWTRAAAANGHFNAQAIVRAMGNRGDKSPPVCSGRRRVPSPSVMTGLSLSPHTNTSPRPPPERIMTLVRMMAPRYDLDPALVLAVIEAESGFRPDIVSNRGARGLMQLIPETASRFGVSDIFDVEDNLRGGMSYLRWLLARFEGDVRLALAGYNAGEGAVEAHGGVPPFAETQTYVHRILGRYSMSHHTYDPSAAAPSKMLTRRSNR